MILFNNFFWWLNSWYWVFLSLRWQRVWYFSESYLISSGEAWDNFLFMITPFAALSWHAKDGFNLLRILVCFLLFLLFRFGLLSLSLLLYLRRFDWWVLQPSSAVHTFFRTSQEVTCSDTVEVLSIVSCLQSGLNLQPLDDCHLEA